MATKWNANAQWPDLKSLNGGNRLAPTKITHTVFNSIVNALIYLKNRK